MSSHYLTCLPIAILGGFLVVVSQAFGPPVLGWVAFGVAIGVITIPVLAQLDRQRGRVQRVIDAGIVALGALLIVFGLVGSGTAVTWLTFAFALGLVTLGVTGLTLHDVAIWRGQHRLEALHWLHEPGVADMTPGRRAA